MGIYSVSRHAVVALSECLHRDLTQKTDKVERSVLCLACVPAGIAGSGRNRPAAQATKGAGLFQAAASYASLPSFFAR